MNCENANEQTFMHHYFNRLPRNSRLIFVVHSNLVSTHIHQKKEQNYVEYAFNKQSRIKI